MAGTEAAFYGTGSKEEMRLEKLILMESQYNPGPWVEVMLNVQNIRNLEDKLSALQALEDLIKSQWSALPVFVRYEVKKYVSKAIVQLSGDEVFCGLERLHVNKLNVILVQILKHQGPIKWRTVIPDLVAAAEGSERVCENFMAVLKLLCEEVLDLSRGEMTQEEIEDLKLSLCSEFRLIHELCLCTLSDSQTDKLICTTLSALHGFLSWLPLGYIFKSPLVGTLLELFPVAQYRNLTLQCLTEIAALNFGGFHDVHYVKMHNRFMVQLQAILTPTSNMSKFYADGSSEEQAFIQNLAVFLTTFYKFHIRVLESTQENIAALLVGLEFLFNMSYMSEREVVKVCLDYWNYLLGQFAVQCFLDSPAIEAARMMCLKVLKGVTKFQWDLLPTELQDGMKKYISEVIVQLLSNEASFRMERLFVKQLNIILVQIMTWEGPVRWQSLIPDLVAAAKESERVCENLMAILKLLSEEVLDISSRGKMTQEEIEDLKQSLSSGFQLVHESKKQPLAVSSKREGSDQQLLERSGSEEMSAVELQKVLFEPDPAQHSKQGAVQKQNAAESVASATATSIAMNEIQQLKVQLEVVSQSVAAKTWELDLANAELQSLRGILAETVSHVENRKNQLQECKESETQSRAQARESLLQPGIAIEASPASNSSGSGLDYQETGGLQECKESETQSGAQARESLLQSEIAIEASPASNSSGSGLDYQETGGLQECKESETQSRAQARESLLQPEIAIEASPASSSSGSGLDSQETGGLQECKESETQSRAQSRESLLQPEIAVEASPASNSSGSGSDYQETGGSVQMAAEPQDLENVVVRLRSAFEDALSKYPGEQTRRWAGLEAELRQLKAGVEKLKPNRMDKEIELGGIPEEVEGLSLRLEKNLLCRKEHELEEKLKNPNECVAELRSKLMDKETELQNISEENEMLKSDIKKREMERVKVTEELVAEVEAAKNAEREARLKLAIVTEEAEQQNLQAVKATEQVEVVQSANSEIETDLREVKVRSDGLGKAMEAPAAILASKGKLTGRTVSLDRNFKPVSWKRCSHSEEREDGNMLKKIGLMLKKSRK